MKNLKEEKKEVIIRFFKDLKNITKFLNNKTVKNFINSLKKYKNYNILLGKPFEEYLDYFYEIEKNLLKMFNDPKYLEKLSNENTLNRVEIFLKQLEIEKEKRNLIFKNIKDDFTEFKNSFKKIANYMRNMLKDFEETRKEFASIKNFPKLHQEFLSDLKKLKEDVNDITTEEEKDINLNYEKIRQIVLDILTQEFEDELVNIISKHGSLPDAEFDPEALEKGIAVEKEHTNSDVLAKAIAKDHLYENPNYYDD